MAVLEIEAAIYHHKGVFLYKGAMTSRLISPYDLFPSTKIPLTFLIYIFSSLD